MRITFKILIGSLGWFAACNTEKSLEPAELAQSSIRITDQLTFSEINAIDFRTLSVV
ncbi:hypothetical protein L0128_04870 [candidate division KSB1 bacterium]|nr:hypothetical protein [candidate division KSB1 bacterium]